MRTICALVAAAVGLATHAAGDSRRVQYGDLTLPLQRALGDRGANSAQFERYVAAIEADTAKRVAEGDRDHLIYYALQSRRFTKRARIEPALSARRFVERLAAEQRARLLADPAFLPAGSLPPDERARLADLVTALGKPSSDTRLTYFRDVVKSRPPVDALYRDYVRVSRFLYLKEFGAGHDAAEVARLYQSRPHSTDTQVDAGFAVALGFGVVQALDPAFRARRVLIVGPGLDVAPRTDLIDEADLQSYQPLAVADALLSLSIASEPDLHVHSVDVNPRVVDALQRLGADRLTWHVFSGVIDKPGEPLAEDYADYLRRLGSALGDDVKAASELTRSRHYQRSIAVRPSAAKIFTAGRLNIISERLSGPPFDLIVITNVLPYFDERALALALVNLSAMLRPGGYLLHNENRATLPSLAAAAGLPAVQMRTVVLGGPRSRPLYDVIGIHQKSRNAS